MRDARVPRDVGQRANRSATESETLREHFLLLFRQPAHHLRHRRANIGLRRSLGGSLLRGVGHGFGQRRPGLVERRIQRDGRMPQAFEQPHPPPALVLVARRILAARTGRVDRFVPRDGERLGDDDDRARQRIRFFDTYRSYVINYNLGQDLARAYVERRVGQGPGADERRWQEFKELLASPRLPGGLQ